MSKRSVALLVSVLTTACGVEFDPPSEVNSLRVMAVQKSVAYAKPGETVDLSMLWHDGSPDAPRPVQITWLIGCFNPPGDSFFQCGQSLAAAQGPGGPPPGVTVAFGDSASFQMPADIISSRPPPADPAVPRYGLTYVFFAACAGSLGQAPPGQTVFPLACYDAAGEPQGPEDFVAGYSAVYAYEEIRNANPIITGFSFGGREVTPACIGAACLTTPQQQVDCAAGDPCIDACSDDGGEDCPPTTITPRIDRASAEVDEVGKLAYGRDFTEQMWLRYYVEGGSVKSEVKLVNDAVKGWIDDYSTEFRAPKAKGVISLWAAAHDNRGGVEWVRLDVGVR